jgi:hypothetical protein
MVAAQKFNEINNIPIATIYGSVSSGTVWRFLKLESKTLTIDLIDIHPGVNARGFLRLTT